MPELAEEHLGSYLDFLWHDTEGFAYVPVQTDPLDHRSWKKYGFEWPRQRASVIKFIMRNSAEGANVFASPALYDNSEHTGQKSHVLGTWTLWMDFDGNAPDHWQDMPVPIPDLRIQSSLPGHEHVYWALEEFLTDTEVIEERNRALSYQLGADTSGWDANQILRPVGTTNFPGPNKQREAKTVTVLDRLYNTSHDLNEFGAITSAKQMVANDIFTGDLPDLQDVLVLHKWPADMWSLFQSTTEDLALPEARARGGRSSALMKLGYYGAEQGFSDEEILVVLQSADNRWQKYVGRRDADNHYLDIINRARQKHGYTSPENLTFDGLRKATSQVGTAEDEVYGFLDFVAADFHVDWLLEGLLAEEGIGLVTGFPGTGKTQFAIQLGAHLATGRDRMLTWNNVAGTKKVLFLSLEMSGGPLHLFLQNISYSYPETQELNRNFKVVPLGKPTPLDIQTGKDYLDALLGEYQPDLVIVDSLQMVMSKEMTDELSVKETMTYLASVRQKHGCAMILIHHNRKKSSLEGKKHPELSDVYGSTYITAAVDFVINLAKHSDTNDKLAVSSLKNRLGPETEQFDVMRNEHLTYIMDDPVFSHLREEAEDEFRSTRSTVKEGFEL